MEFDDFFDSEDKRDPVTGKKKKENPLNKARINKHELDDWMNPIG